MEQIPWRWPPIANSLVTCNHNDIDSLMKNYQCVVVSLGLLQSNFKHVCHGIRASFMWAKVQKLPVYIRHLEDFYKNCEISTINQLLIAIDFAALNKISIIAFTTDSSKLYNLIAKKFKYRVQLPNIGTSQSNVSIDMLLFKDVPGRDKIKNQLMSLFYSSNPVEGVIFYGLPGKGKTRMARALYGELRILKSIYFLNIAIHDILKSHVGESEAAIRSLFRNRSEYRIIFMDELDVLFSSMESYAMKVLWQLHAEIDKLSDNPNAKTMIIGATNFINKVPDSLKRRLPNLIYFD
eukprot:NODE_133_length_18153_cov_0.298050.p5 type:complete len:294 gc:universal NODE_133_length_18153_cov_0.298050:4540-5421(+)